MVNTKKYRGSYDKNQAVEVSSLKSVIKDELNNVLLDFNGSLTDLKNLMDSAAEGEFEKYIHSNNCMYYGLEIQKQRAQAIVDAVVDKLIDLNNQLKNCRNMFAITWFPKNEIEDRNRSALDELSVIINQISLEVK